MKTRLSILQIHRLGKGHASVLVIVSDIFHKYIFVYYNCYSTYSTYIVCIQILYIFIYLQYLFIHVYVMYYCVYVM